MAITDIRLLTRADQAAVLRIQAQCYEARLNEPWVSFESKLNEAAESCWLALADDQAAGYLFAMPLSGGDSPSLPMLAQPDFPSLSGEPTWLYLHDLAISPSARGLGLGRILIEQAKSFAHANGKLKLCLVAVQDSVAFWARSGFVPTVNPGPVIQAKLDSFERGATFMTLSK